MPRFLATLLLLSLILAMALIGADTLTLTLPRVACKFLIGSFGAIALLDALYRRDAARGGR